MATKSFAINTEPHVADVGGTELKFQPEVIGAEFAQAYAGLRAVQQKVKGSKASSTKHAKEEATDPAVLIELNQAMRDFIATFLLPESAAVFNRHELTYKGEVQVFTSAVLAASKAEELGVTDTLVDKSMRLPDRILVQLMEWVAELYGGGSGNDRGGQSSASA